MGLIVEVKAALDAVDPRLFYLFLAFQSWLVVTIWNKVSPQTFEKLPQRVKSLPAMLLAAITATAASRADTLAAELIEIVIGAFSGTMAVGLHHVIKAQKKEGE